MKKILYFLSVAALFGSCQEKETQLFDGAEWIGTDEVVLYAPYLQEFSLSFDVTLNSLESEAAFLLGGNDERLLSRNLNHMGIENKYGEIYMSFVVGHNSISIKRKGYDPKGEELTINTIDLPETWASSTMHVKAEIEQGLMHLFVNDSVYRDIKITPNEVTGGDYIPYPVLGEIGSKGDAKFQNVEVRNLRSPYTLYYSADDFTGKELFDPSHLGMPELYCTFDVKDKKIESAKLYSTARGVYDFYVNEKKTAHDFFAPGLSQYNKTHYYQTYDIQNKLTPGKNEFKVLLGEGWWMGTAGFWSRSVNHFGDQLALLAKAVIRYEDGEEQIITTNDKDWLVSTNGLIRYSSRFHGEIIDGSLTEGRDNAVPAKIMSLEDHTPSEFAANIPAVDDYSEYQLLPQPDEPVTIQETLTAQSVEEVRPGVFVYDMGQNMAGLPKITFHGLKKGQTVRMRYAEVKYPDMKEYALNKGMIMMENIRAAFAQDMYIASGEDVEVFAPHFTLHGYRYVEISGIDKALPVNDVKGRVLSSIKLASGFECSNPLVNRLWQNIQWSTLANFISIPTDCPQRNERLGWGGDISVFSRTATYMSDSYEFLRRHLRNIRDMQEEDGHYADVAPVGGGFGGFLWGASGITIAYEAWRQSGRTEILDEHYDSMKKYIEYVQKNYIEAETGIFIQARIWPGLGDWLNLEYNKIDLTGQYECYYIFVLRCMSEMASALGRTEDVELYNKVIDERKQFYIANYVDQETGKTLWSAYDYQRKGQPCDYEATYVLPLAFDVIDDAELRQKMVDNFVATIERQNSTDEGVVCPPYSLMTGFVTTAWISKALTDNGRADVAYRLLQNTSYPSWLYPVTQGATTIWERLNSYNDFEGFGKNNSMNSFNHYSFGAVGQWLMNRVLGIERDPEKPGFEQFILRPVVDPTGEMTYAKGWYKSSYGKIEAGWEKTSDNKYIYSFTIPRGTTATMVFPNGETKLFVSGSYKVEL